MPARPRPSDDALFLTLLALLTTALDYRFGLGNQTEALPLVLHALDPDLFDRDFFVQSSAAFGPRFYYVKLLAALASWLPLPVVMLGLTLGVNAALAFVSHAAARDLLRADRLGGLLAATLTLSVGSFPLGLVTDIRFQDLQPGSLAIPFGLGALWAGLRSRPVRAGLLAALGSIPHPLYGMETGALALGAAACVAWLDGPKGRPFAQRLRALLPCLAGGALLGAAALLLWGLPWVGANAERLPEAEFIAALTYRSPHHYLPSTFPPAHYVLLAAFVWAGAIALRLWVRHQGSPRAGLAFAAVPLAVLLLCMGGIVFVELWPSRLWVTAQPFRLLYVVKWQGFLLLGWLLARWIGTASPPRMLLAWTVYVANGAAQPLIALAALAGERADAWLRRRRTELSPWWLPGLVLGAALPLIALLGKPREALALWLALPLLVTLGQTGRRWARALAVLVVAGAVALAAANRGGRLLDWDVLRPVASLADHRGDDADLARWMRDHTPRDALVHVPPDWERFRLIARRAVVVDWKALPFSDAALREWRSRMRFAYGDAPGGGFPALERMARQHRAIDDARLEAIAERYGAEYAVLHAETGTRLPVLHQSGGYKVVALPGGPRRAKP